MNKSVAVSSDFRESEHVLRGAAELYERHLVPALFHGWTGCVLNAIGMQKWTRLVDVACGTGVLARAAARRVGPKGLVVGVDPNRGMLEVARNRAHVHDRTSTGVTWLEARAGVMPFLDETFDAVACQFGLMYFEDKVAAIREMLRILRPGGRLALTVWDALEVCPGFRAEAQLLSRFVGPELAGESWTPFSLGDPNVLRRLFKAAGIKRPSITTHIGQARFPSIRHWIYSQVKGGSLATKIRDWKFADLLDEADRELISFAAADGTVSFATPAHLIVVDNQ
jgi:SAM-dependent methyltransferase